jgi:hypothetical protein
MHNWKKWQKKVTNNLRNVLPAKFFKKPPTQITIHKKRNPKVMMDASPTSTHFNNHTTSPIQLLHLQVIPDVSAPGQQCFLPVIQNAFLFTVAYYKATANVK